MAKRETALAKSASEEKLALLAGQFPDDPSFSYVPLPRLGLVSQDITEETRNPVTKKKEIKIVTDAGEFFLDVQDEEETLQADGTKKKNWQKTFLGTTVDVIFAFQRKQLKYYDGVSYTSSDVYDSPEDIIRLWKDGAEIDSGTPAELKAKYPGLTRTGKPTSKLEDHAVLFVLYKPEGADDYGLYQMNLRGTSLYAFRDFKKKFPVNTIVTRLDSEPKTQGTTDWNQMTFEKVRNVTEEEADRVIAEIQEIQDTVERIRQFREQKAAGDAEFNNYGKGDEEVKDEDLPFQDDKPQRVTARPAARALPAPAARRRR